MIIGPPKTSFENRMYQLRIRCANEYPIKSPDVRFLSKIVMTCVDKETGIVNPSIIDNFWRHNSRSIKSILQYLRKMLTDKENRLTQPLEGTNF